MKYTLTIESDKVELWGFGIRLDDDEARRVIRHAAQWLSIHEQELHTRKNTVLRGG